MRIKYNNSTVCAILVTAFLVNSSQISIAAHDNEPNEPSQVPISVQKIEKLPVFREMVTSQIVDFLRDGSSQKKVEIGLYVDNNPKPDEEQKARRLLARKVCKALETLDKETPDSDIKILADSIVSEVLGEKPVPVMQEPVPVRTNRSNPQRVREYEEYNPSPTKNERKTQQEPKAWIIAREMARNMANQPTSNQTAERLQKSLEEQGERVRDANQYWLEYANEQNEKVAKENKENLDRLLKEAQKRKEEQKRKKTQKRASQQPSLEEDIPNKSPARSDSVEERDPAKAPAPVEAADPGRRPAGVNSPNPSDSNLVDVLQKKVDDPDVTTKLDGPNKGNKRYVGIGAYSMLTKPENEILPSLSGHAFVISAETDTNGKITKAETMGFETDPDSPAWKKAKAEGLKAKLNCAIAGVPGKVLPVAPSTLAKVDNIFWVEVDEKQEKAVRNVISKWDKENDYKLNVTDCTAMAKDVLTTLNANGKNINVPERAPVKLNTAPEDFVCLLDEKGELSESKSIPSIILGSNGRELGRAVRDRTDPGTLTFLPEPLRPNRFWSSEGDGIWRFPNKYVEMLIEKNKK